MTENRRWVSLCHVLFEWEVVATKPLQVSLLGHSLSACQDSRTTQVLLLWLELNTPRPHHSTLAYVLTLRLELLIQEWLPFTVLQPNSSRIWYSDIQWPQIWLSTNMLSSLVLIANYGCTDLPAKVSCTETPIAMYDYHIGLMSSHLSYLDIYILLSYWMCGLKLHNILWKE